MKRLLIILFLLFGIGISNDYLAQTGGRKREGRSHARRSRGHKSAGNADRFAGGGSRKSIFSRLFKKKQGSWHYKSSGSARSHVRTNRNLFTRYRSRGRQSNAETLDRQNSARAKSRVRGSKVFGRKKY